MRQSAVDRALARIKNLATAETQNANKTQKRTRILVTGCVLEKDKERLLEYCDGIFGIDRLIDLPTVLKDLRLVTTEARKADETQKVDGYLKIAPRYQSTIVAYVPIMTGCNNFCSYCVVPYLRNKEISRPPKDIIDEIDRIAHINFIVGVGVT